MPSRASFKVVPLTLPGFTENLSALLHSPCSRVQVQHGYLTPGQAAKTVEKFLRSNLPDWVMLQKHNPQEAEKGLTEYLCNFLQIRCRDRGELFNFFHESPQTAKRVVDMGIYPGKEEGLYVADKTYPLNKPFYVLEAKRLPAPRSNREREYVVGNASKRGGGIERFKENPHGDGLQHAGIIAYIQGDRQPSWLEKVNQWIMDLVTHPPTTAHSTWSQNDLLRQETTDTPIVRECSSTHTRAYGDALHLWHFWLYLTAAY
jgi:hypothetical protein